MYQFEYINYSLALNKNCLYYALGVLNIFNWQYFCYSLQFKCCKTFPLLRGWGGFTSTVMSWSLYICGEACSPYQKQRKWTLKRILFLYVNFSTTDVIELEESLEKLHCTVGATRFYECCKPLFFKNLFKMIICKESECLSIAGRMSVVLALFGSRWCWKSRIRWKSPLALIRNNATSSSLDSALLNGLNGVATVILDIKMHFMNNRSKRFSTKLSKYNLLRSNQVIDSITAKNYWSHVGTLSMSLWSV